MPPPRVVIELASDSALVRDLAAGEVFVAGHGAALHDECELVVRVGDGELTLQARVVRADPEGAALELVDCDPGTLRWLASMASADAAPALVPLDPPGGSDATPDDDGRGIPGTVHERLRGLTVVEQLRVAQQGDVSERVVLERIYGKSVWEALLRNTRITGPEVARIARMGALPRTLVEIIVGNGAWIQIGEVRRALLTNPRLGTDQVLRVLRLLPKHELKLTAIQTAYPQAVRDAAKRLLRDKA